MVPPGDTGHGRDGGIEGPERRPLDGPYRDPMTSAVPMSVGIFTAMTDEHVTPARLARAIEDRGFESLFVPEHSHIPVARETPFPGGGDLPHDYARNLDPVVTLAAASAATTTLRLGTAVTLIVQRDPIHLAKEFASLDLVSAGRIELGVGAGWLREEMRNHGTDPRTRTVLLDERLAAVRAIWTGSPAEYHGTLVDFDPILSWPKPVQTPHPPLWLGGWGPTTLSRVVGLDVGWLAPPGLAPDRLRDGLSQLVALAEDHGGAVPPVLATVFDPTAALLDELAALGVTRTLIDLPVGPEADGLATLDRLSALSAAHLSPVTA
jgi:probable F420-dependent oxidoreductase